MINTWYELADSFCARRNILGYETNDFYEEFSTRRYNYAQTADTKAVRLIFLKGAGADQKNRTLVRNGRFIWCKNLRYEGKDDNGYRQLSFTIAKGKKRFLVSENLVLCLPSSVYVNNNSFMRNYEKIFPAFSSVFCYDKSLRLMFKNSEFTELESFVRKVEEDNPHKTGSLVAARKGYFMPNRDELTSKMHILSKQYCEEKFCSNRYNELIGILTHHHSLASSHDSIELVEDFFEWSKLKSETDHPYGIILGRSRETSAYAGRELYRVNFGGTTYERVHPVQMEVVS